MVNLFRKNGGADEYYDTKSKVKEIQKNQQEEPTKKNAVTFEDIVKKLNKKDPNSLVKLFTVLIETSSDPETKLVDKVQLNEVISDLYGNSLS
jgi:hypothetical protein